MRKGFCKFFDEGRCCISIDGFPKPECPYKYPEFEDCEDFEESED
jgi:hypothetical protein